MRRTLGGNYDDIINMPHYVSAKRPHMSLYDRAVQFSRFAAQTGHEAAIEEAARLTDHRLELSEQDIVILNAKLQILRGCIPLRPEIEVTYFCPDERKEGGAYLCASGLFKRIDEQSRMLVFADGCKFALKDISQIAGNVFTSLVEDG